MVYGIDDANMLVVKRIAVRGEEIEPIDHPYSMTETDQGTYYDNLNRIIPITGYLLFSTLWAFRYLYSETLPKSEEPKNPLFEANVNKGHISGVREISGDVRRKTVGRDRTELAALWQGNTPDERLANVEHVWDITAAILPRRYDALYMSIWYFNFREYMDENKSQTQ